MNLINIMTNIISPALDACWGFFNSLWTSLPGSMGFFLAVFTMVCAIRFLIMPLLGYHHTYARSSAEERPSGYPGVDPYTYRTPSYVYGRSRH